MHCGQVADVKSFKTRTQEDSLYLEWDNESVYLEGPSCVVDQVKDLGQKPLAPPKDKMVSPSEVRKRRMCVDVH